jgi:hypothetical protein
VTALESPLPWLQEKEMTDVSDTTFSVEYQKAIRTLMSTPSILPDMDKIVGELAARNPVLFNMIVEYLNREKSEDKIQ